MSVVLSGTAYRPSSGPYRSPNPFGIRPGQAVRWTAATPIAEIATAFNKHGVTVYVIGDNYHLRGGQDHTPWSKVLGRIFACDVMYGDAAKMERWLVGILRGSEDTSWIDYVNINNKQYNGSGTYQGYSGDHHLHISVEKGAVNGHVSRFVQLIHAFFGQKTTTTAPKPVPTVTKREGRFMFFQVQGKPEVYISNFVTYRHVPDPATLKSIQGRLKKLGASDADLVPEVVPSINEAVWGKKVD